MTHIPRASVCITILGDEDFRLLMTSKGGPEAFGVFMAMLVVGRERLQQEKARRVGDTDALALDNRPDHACAMAHLPRKKLDACLTLLRDVAAETDGSPWMYLDGDGKLVIRSFFKFNTSESWGGSRPGAGRPRKENQTGFKSVSSLSSRIQDDSQNNHLEINLKSSRLVSDSVSDSNSKTPPTPPAGGAASAGESCNGKTKTRKTPTVLPATPGDPLPPRNATPMSRHAQATAAAVQAGNPGPGDVVPDQAVLDDLYARLPSWFPGYDTTKLWNSVLWHQRQIESAWFFRVLKRLRLQNYSDPGWNLVKKIIDRWFVNGGPDRGPEDGYDDDLRMIPPSQRTDIPLERLKPSERGTPPPRPVVDEKTKEHYRHYVNPKTLREGEGTNMMLEKIRALAEAKNGEH